MEKKPKVDFWMPLLDIERDAYLRDFPDAEPQLELRDGVWWLHVTANVVSEERARELVRLVIAEAIAGRAVHELPPEH